MPTASAERGMFTQEDIKFLLGTLGKTAQASAPDDYLLLSQDGNSLVSAATARRRLLDLLGTSTGVAIKDLEALLDVQDASSILTWADDQPGLATPGNQHLSVPPWMQKVVAIHIFDTARRRFTKLDSISLFWGLPRKVLQQIIDAYSKSFYDLDDVDDYLCHPGLKARETAELRRLAKAASELSEAQNLSNTPSRPPEKVTLSLLRTVQEDQSPDSYQIEGRDGEVWLIPCAAIQLKTSQQLEQLVTDCLSDLHEKARCFVSTSSQYHDEIITRLGVSSARTEQPNGQSTSTILDKHPSSTSADWLDDVTVIASRPHINQVLHMYQTALPSVCKQIWTESQDRPTALNARALELLRNGFDKDDTQSLVLFSTCQDGIAQDYRSEMTRLGQDASLAFQKTIRDSLQGPLALYQAGLETTKSDSTLHEHQRDFLLNYFKTDLLAEAVKAVQVLPLAPPRAMSSEWAKLQSAIKEARSIEDLQTAMKRLSRKIKLPDASKPIIAASVASRSGTPTSPSRSETATSPEPTSPLGPEAAPPSIEQGGDLLRLRDAALTTKLKILKRTKRPSDVLQQAVWILLACISTTPALFISSGRDASRMLKVYRRMAGEVGGGGEEGAGFIWVGAGTNLEGFRDKVKEGMQRPEDVEAARALAEGGFEGRRLR